MANENRPKLDEFTHDYLTAALFTEDPSPLSGEFGERDDWSIERIDASSLAQAIEDCHKFQSAHRDDIAADLARAGRDFWFTRNGHGVGFWDGDWPEDVGDRLTDAATAFGEVYVTFEGDGDDRIITIE